MPSLGGIGTASALGKFYAMLANGGRMEGRPYFSGRALGWMSATLVNGPDGILQLPTAFSAGFGPSPRAFGQPGAGGGHAFADPQNGIAFAYVMNQMEMGVMPNEKSLSIVEALYAGL